MTARPRRRMMTQRKKTIHWWVSTLAHHCHKRNFRLENSLTVSAAKREREREREKRRGRWSFHQCKEETAAERDMDSLHRSMRCIFLAFDICFDEVLHWRQHVWNQRWIEQIEQQVMWTSFGGLCIATAFSISNMYEFIFLSIYRHVEANILAQWCSSLVDNEHQHCKSLTASKSSQTDPTSAARESQRWRKVWCGGRVEASKLAPQCGEIVCREVQSRGMAQFARIQTNVPKGKRHITKSFLIAVGSQHEMTTMLYDRSVPISESVSPKFEDEYHEAKVARDNKRERHTHLTICDNSWAASNVWQKSRRRRCLKWFIRETYTSILPEYVPKCNCIVHTSYGRCFTTHFPSFSWERLCFIVLRLAMVDALRSVLRQNLNHFWLCSDHPCTANFPQYIYPARNMPDMYKRITRWIWSENPNN